MKKLLILLLCMSIAVAPGCAWLQGNPAEISQPEYQRTQALLDQERDQGRLSPERHRVLSEENYKQSLPNRGEADGLDKLFEIGATVLGIAIPGGYMVARKVKNAVKDCEDNIERKPSRSAAEVAALKQELENLKTLMQVEGRA